MRTLQGDNRELFRRIAASNATPSNPQPLRSVQFHDAGLCPKDPQSISVHGEEEQDTAAPDDPTDGMGAVIFTNEEDYGFFDTTLTTSLFNN